jgi:hypothetical protein
MNENDKHSVLLGINVLEIIFDARITWGRIQNTLISFVSYEWAQLARGFFPSKLLWHSVI